MRHALAALAFALIAGCGAETAATAATGAAIKKEELEQGEKTRERTQRKIDKATEVMGRRTQQAASAGSP